NQIRDRGIRFANNPGTAVKLQTKKNGSLFPPINLSPTLRTGLELLLQAHDTAQSLNTDPWQFACEIDVLTKAGVTHTELRSLIHQGIVDHAQEKPGRGRTFRPRGGLRLFLESCFVLTEQGVNFA